MTENDTARIPYKAFIAACARAFGVNADEIISVRRTTDVVRARFAAALLIKRHRLDASLPEIGRRLGGKDHTTVLHAVKRAERFCKTDVDFADRYLIAERDALSWPTRKPEAVICVVPATLPPQHRETPPAVKIEAVKPNPDFWQGYEPPELREMRQSVVRSTLAMSKAFDREQTA